MEEEKEVAAAADIEMKTKTKKGKSKSKTKKKKTKKTKKTSKKTVEQIDGDIVPDETISLGHDSGSKQSKGMRTTGSTVMRVIKKKVVIEEPLPPPKPREPSKASIIWKNMRKKMTKEKAINWFK